jgi:hypothetical protein
LSRPRNNGPSHPGAETVVTRYEDELEAETAAGYLRSTGIPARVRYQASIGLPRSTVPVRVIAPFGDFELLVADADVERAREALAPAGPPAPRPRRYRWLGWVLIAVMLAPLIIGWLAGLARIR